MIYKHSKTFAEKQIKRLNQKIDALITENKNIYNQQFTGYKANCYKHSDEWYRKKKSKNTKRINDYFIEIAEIRNEHCIY